MKKKMSPSIWKMVLKVLAILFTVVFWYSMADSCIEYILDRNDFYYNKADIKRSCDYYYYDKNFGGLQELFRLYSMDEPEFDLYREVVKGFEDYQSFRMYQKAAEAGLEGAEEKAEEYKAKVLENAENCRFEMNQKDLDGYVDNIS